MPVCPGLLLSLLFSLALQSRLFVLFALLAVLFCVCFRVFVFWGRHWWLTLAKLLPVVPFEGWAFRSPAFARRRVALALA